MLPNSAELFGRILSVLIVRNNFKLHFRKGLGTHLDVPDVLSPNVGDAPKGQLSSRQKKNFRDEPPGEGLSLLVRAWMSKKSPAI